MTTNNSTSTLFSSAKQGWAAESLEAEEAARGFQASPAFLPLPEGRHSRTQPRSGPGPHGFITQSVPPEGMISRQAVTRLSAIMSRRDRSGAGCPPRHPVHDSGSREGGDVIMREVLGVGRKLVKKFIKSPTNPTDSGV